MKSHTFTFALECVATIEAPSREAAIKQLILATRAGSRADLWPPFDEESAMRGEPAKGLVSNVAIRRIGSL